jgi:3'-5' exoribonuclease-like protein
VTKIFYDTEFIEDGKTIDLISIALVAEDGREYYAVCRDAPWKRIAKHQWLMGNVVPHLPKAYGDARNHLPKSWLFNFADPLVKDRAKIAEEVRAFIGHTPQPELWAWYAAYDHVVLAQLFGPMIQLPDCIPMWTNDLKQEVMRRGNPRLPAQTSGTHDALADARHVRRMYEALVAIPSGAALESETPA